ncbi:GNAT family N-acetyltransferase [Streptomyces gobiensis]|uniref:GNAT family N-acetyltransferase n=1 Tax=Streptomyces gobiensis TaxID=2875706 RepID=UPI001E5A6BAB|nr:GNAT family N-acetyltransferase [Streptomyces gobiensis]UGY92011.1 GNAT family N-acetyltransferase [Streptomyces gobiensis]
MEAVELEMSGLVLRPWGRGDADLDAALRGFSDPEFRRWNTVLAPSPDLPGAQCWLASRGEKWESGESASWAITDPADGGRILGNAEVGAIDYGFRTARITYWLLPEARGRGAATHALLAITRWAFATLRLHRLELGHAAANDASCRVAQRGGYPAEGLLRGAMVSADGVTFQDVHLHARLATD